MKKIHTKITLVVVSFTLIFFSSCETFDLDKTLNPNALTPEQADIDFFLNSIQEDFVRQIEGDADYDANDNWQSGGNTNGDGLSLFGSHMTRLLAMTQAKQYNSAYQGSDSDDEWTNAYLGILADIRAMTPLAQEGGLTRHIGISQFVEAYVITAMVDFYGDIPYSEAILGVENLNPAIDSGASIYDAALALLDNAITNFGNTATADPAFDAFYDNDFDKWINAANTLKMRLYNQRRLVDPGAAAAINAIVTSGNYITDSDDDFQYNWPGASATQPDTRHPRYGLNYQSAGAGDYNSNWLMNLMDTTDDPRIRYYFFRQSGEVPGSTGVPPDEETLQCSLQTAPAHYIAGGFPFCYLDNGYWGRNHMDDDGTPPDGFLRTTFGVYPVGGNFDDNRYADADPDNDGVAPGAGGGGAGITPILTAAWVDFMLAEIEMANGSFAAAKTHMENGMNKHITKVQSFIGLDSNAVTSFEPTAGDVSTYVTAVGDAFDAAVTPADKWNVFADQFFIASYGNGIESYNFYRRTGYPTTLEPSLDPSPGTFIRSMFYPANAVNTNSNITQKSDVTQPVFWDTGAAPVAN